MIDRLTSLLHEKGYHNFNGKGIFIKDCEDSVLMVLLNVYSMGDSLNNYESFKQRAEYNVVTTFKKHVETLYLIVNRDGMFDEGIIDIAANIQGVWLLAADTGRIYIYENQSDQFDDLHQYLEDGLFSIDGDDFQDVSFRFTPMNCAIVIINIIVFLAIIFINKSYYALYDTNIMLKMGAMSYDYVYSGRWYVIITSLFVHFGISHLFNNMLILMYVGCELERRINSIWYLAVYIGSGIAGNLASLWYYSKIGEINVVSAGASGAVFGVIGTLIVILTVSAEHSDDLNPKRLLFMVILTIYYGLSTVGIDNAAHIGGFCFGLFGGFLLSKILGYDKIKLA